MNLPNEIIREIIYYLLNEDIFNVYTLNKNYKHILDDDVVKNYIIYREHPMIFNLIDNFCNICNLKTIFLYDKLTIGKCKHFD